MRGDDTGDNISRKNISYADLCIFYWAWKNDQTEIVGFAGYRRFLDLGLVDDSSLIPNRVLSFNNRYFRNSINKTEINIKTVLQSYDIILAKPNTIRSNIRQQYSDCHIKEHFDIMEKAIVSIFPEWEPYIEKVFDSQGSLYMSLFVAKWDFFNEYMSALFRILESIESKIKVPNNPYQTRFMAFLAERIFNVFLAHYIDTVNPKIMLVPVITIKDPILSKYYIHAVKRLYRLFGKNHYLDGFSPF